MKGRRPKPTALHRLHGTFHATKHADRKSEPVAEGDLVDPPPGLNPDQMEGWKYALANAPKAVLRRIDRGMLAVWVIAEDRLYSANKMQAMLDANTRLKLLINGPLGVPEVSPYEMIIDKASKRLMTAASILGFSPTARPRLIRGDTAATEDEADAWAPLRLKVLPGGRAD